MINSYHRNYYFDKEEVKESVKILAIVLALNIIILKENLLYYALSFYFIFRAILYFGIGTKVNKYYVVQRERLPHMLKSVVFFSLLIVIILRYSIQNLHDLQLTSMIIGLFFLAISIFFYLKKNEFKVRRTVEDFPNLKQELVYQELDDMSVFAKYRTKKVPKFKTSTKKRLFGLWHQKVKVPNGYETIVDYSDVDLTLTDDRTKKLTPVAKKEIMDIINDENKDFYNYSLTRLKDEKEADLLIKRLSLDVSQIKKGAKGLKYKSDKKNYYKDVLDGSFDVKYDGKCRYSDGYRFARFWYRTMKKNFDSIDVKYDFKETLKLFDGIFEYAMIHMYVTHSKYFNRPIGNSPTEALYDFLYTGNKNAFELCGAMDSSIFTSVKKKGAAYMTGYLLTCKNLGIHINE